jgi:hypothetical protein
MFQTKTITKIAAVGIPFSSISGMKKNGIEAATPCHKYIR